MTARPRWSREEMEQARQRIHAALETPVGTAPGSVRGALDIAESAIPAAAPPAPSYGPAFQAAAVLSRFRLDDVRELASGAEEIARLQSRSTQLREQGWRTLTPDIRNAILGSMNPAEILKLVTRHEQSGDALQAAIHAALGGVTPDALRTLSTGALAALVQIYDGVTHLAKLPPRDQIERKLQLARLLDPLRQITKTFSGRASELQQLRDYVGVLSTGSWLSDGLRAIGNAIFTPTPTPPFVIYGPGGVGKTTLTARFILEHALAAESQRFPFAYLDFDRPTVNAEQAPTLLGEAIRQIGLQYDAAFHASERLRDRWEKRLAASTTVDAVPYVRDFAGFLDTLEVREGPVLLVLDTFEEVQRRSEAYVQSVLQLVNVLTQHVPRLRVVIAGRSTVEGVPVAKQLELAAFDHASAVAYLGANNVAPAAAERIAAQAHGNPLTLTLAIELYRRDPEELRGFDGAQFTDASIQSALFDRILLHISDPEVRLLAHPGLVLRRVTPEIIREVLAGPCGISVPDDARAEQLFNKLGEDNTLVTRVEPRVLIHRADVRRMMLRPLRAAEPAKVTEIHRGAIAFYDRSDDLISRAEAAYHRLCLGEEAELTGELEPLLVNAIEDLPLPSQAILASRYELELSEEAREAADQETWERITARRLNELLRTGTDNLSKNALLVLDERVERSGHTDLLVVEAMCVERFGHPEKAREFARRGIDAYRAAGNSTDLFTMLLVAAEIERRGGRLDAAHSYQNDAEEIARRRNDAMMLVHVLTDRARLLRTEGAEVEPDLVRDLAEAAARVPDAKWMHDATLLRNVVAETALVDTALVSRAIWLGALNMRRSDFDYLSRRTGYPADVVLQRLAEAPTREWLEALVAVLRQEEAAEDGRLSSPAAQSTNVKLRTAQREQLRDLLVQQYGSSLASFVEVRYERGLESFSLAEESDVPRTAMDVIRAAEREGWLNELIIGMWRSRFMTPEVLRFVDSIGMGPAVKVAKGKTPAPEKHLRALLTDYRSAIGALEMRTCMIDAGDEQTGCGFLVADGKVITADAALKSTEPGVTFDSVAVKGKTVDGGRRMTTSLLIQDWSRWRRLHVQKSWAQYPVDAVRSAPDAPIRGAVTFSTATIDPRAPLFWLWRSKEGTFLSGASQVVLQPDGSHIVETESTVEMIGAPCFDAALNVVGLLLGPSANDPRLSTITTVTAPASFPSAPE